MLHTAAWVHRWLCTSVPPDDAQAFRFGVQDPEALKAIDMAFELAPAPSSDVYKGAMKTLTLVFA